MRYLSRRVRLYRLHLGATRKQIARRARVSPRMLGYYEGGTVPPADVLGRLARALERVPAEFYGR